MVIFVMFKVEKGVLRVWAVGVEKIWRWCGGEELM